MRRHPNRWPQPGPGRESRREEHTVTVRPGPLNPTAFCYTDPNHRTPALHLPHFQTSVVRDWEIWGRCEKGKLLSLTLKPPTRSESWSKTTTSPKKLFQAFRLNTETVDAWQIWWGHSITGGHLPTHAGLWLWALGLPKVRGGNTGSSL